MRVNYHTENFHVLVVRPMSFYRIYIRFYSKKGILLHRESKPAKISTKGYREWRDNGELLGYCYCSKKTKDPPSICVHPGELITINCVD